MLPTGNLLALSCSLTSSQRNGWFSNQWPYIWLQWDLDHHLHQSNDQLFTFFKGNFLASTCSRYHLSEVVWIILTRLGIGATFIFRNEYHLQEWEYDYFMEMCSFCADHIYLIHCLVLELYFALMVFFSDISVLPGLDYLLPSRNCAPDSSLVCRSSHLYVTNKP